MKHSIRKMWRIQGLEGSPKNDRNIYCNYEQAEMFAPVPSYIYKVEVIELK